MFNYMISQWLFFFYFYCFFGWCFESAYVSIKSKKLVNRGFMRGPFLPLYGSGAIMMLVVSMPFRDNVLYTYIAGVIGATVLEYVTGVTMESLFKVRYWDYSNQPFNFQGHICLGSSIAWGFLTILMTRFVHMPVENIALSMPPTILKCMVAVTSVYIVADFTLSFKAALDLRDILVRMERAKEELERMQRRLDVMIAFNNEEKEQKKQEKEQKKQERALYLSELSAGIEQRLLKLKESIQSYGESEREEITELRVKYDLSTEHQKDYRRMLGFYKRDMIRNNPMMVSKKFQDALEELKNIVNGKREP